MISTANKKLGALSHVLGGNTAAIATRKTMGSAVQKSKVSTSRIRSMSRITRKCNPIEIGKRNANTVWPISDTVRGIAMNAAKKNVVRNNVIK
mmetsp:Transcript_21414/g.42968  ORF Transcript_21414/g.42968 Transcript_21414/m.42968 type:complete len:93 (-) Transcript_21414:316-594(-)